MTHTYTHQDKDGVLWRFEGGRPISEIADRVMADMSLLRELPSEEELKEAMAPFYTPPKEDPDMLRSFALLRRLEERARNA